MFDSTLTAVAAETTPTPKPLPKRTRFCTVTGLWREERFISDLRLRGAWLRRFGFVPGLRLLVTAEPGRIVLTFEQPVDGDIDAGDPPLSRAGADRLARGFPAVPARWTGYPR